MEYKNFNDMPLENNKKIHILSLSFGKDSPIAFKANKSLLEYKKDFANGFVPKRRK